MAIYLNIDGEDYNQYFPQLIEDVSYVFHVYYNTRQSGWYVSIYDGDTFDYSDLANLESMLLGGVRLMPNGDILEGVERGDKLPTGALICADFDALGISKLVDVTLGNFDEVGRFRLTYFTEQEVTEFGLDTTGSKYYFQSLSTIPRDDLPVVPATGETNDNS